LAPFNASDASREFHLAAGGLRRLAVQGAAVTVFSQGVALAVQTIATLVLARLLTPADFGVVGMVTTFSLLLMNFGLNGFTEAVVQWEEMDHFLASNLFWINIGVGVFLTIGFAAAGSLLARFYRNPLVAHVAVGISLTILMTSVCVMHLALLKRAMRFSVISANDICSRAASVAVSIVLAWKGWGYWALVAGTIALPLTASIGAWWLCRWVPSLPRRGCGTGSLVRFAINVYGRFTINYFARNTDNLLVGWRFNADALGFYKKAYDLFALAGSQLTAPLTVVAVSALSRLNKDPAQFRRYLTRALEVIAFVGMGMGADLTLVGRDMVRLVLGPQWGESARIFVIFGPGVGIMLLYSTHGWIHLSIGRPDRWFRWGILEFAFTTILFLVTLPLGPVGIAAAWTTSCWILAVPAFWYAGRPIQFGVGPVLAAVWKYVAAALLAGCACAAIIREIPSFASPSGTRAALEGVIIISTMFLVLYLSSVIVLHRGCAPLYGLVALLRELLPPDKLPPSSATAVPSQTDSGSGAFPLSRGESTG
jgi:PST family polysaccharide transporter